MMPIRKSSSVAVICVFLGLLSGCASTQGGDMSAGEDWVGKVSGMAEGDLTLMVSETMGKGESPVTGSLSMNLAKTAGAHGSGKVTGRIRGSIVNGKLEAVLSGRVVVTEGASRIRGRMTGTFSASTASGKWSFSHVAGVHSGRWQAEKVR